MTGMKMVEKFKESKAGRAFCAVRQWHKKRQENRERNRFLNRALGDVLVKSVDEVGRKRLDALDAGINASEKIMEEYYGETRKDPEVELNFDARLMKDKDLSQNVSQKRAEFYIAYEKFQKEDKDFKKRWGASLREIADEKINWLEKIQSRADGWMLRLFPVSLGSFGGGIELYILEHRPTSKAIVGAIVGAVLAAAGFVALRIKHVAKKRQRAIEWTLSDYDRVCDMKYWLKSWRSEDLERSKLRED